MSNQYGTLKHCTVGLADDVGEADGEGVRVGYSVYPLQNEGGAVESLQMVSTIHSLCAKIFAYTPDRNK
jgi:hypothetical protein